MMNLSRDEGLLHIISHTDLDGVAAAALAWYANSGNGRPIRLSLTGYGEVDNLILETLRSGTQMLALDLSPQFQATVDEIDTSFKGDTPFLFDHHKTTFERYDNRPWAVIDIAHCGALVYWNWLFAGNMDAQTQERIEPLRGIVHIANDRDLWINENPDSRLWQAMVTLCGEWGALTRLIASPCGELTPSERASAERFVAQQEERFNRAKENIVRSRISDGSGDMAFLGDGHLEFGDTSDFCGLLLDRPDAGTEPPQLVALAYRKPAGNWAVSMRSRGGFAGKVVSLLKDGRKIRGGGHGDAAALYFPNNYTEASIRESIVAALAAERESSSGLGVSIGDLLKGRM